VISEERRIMITPASSSVAAAVRSLLEDQGIREADVVDSV